MGHPTPHTNGKYWWQHRLAFTWAKYSQLIQSSWRNGLRARPKSNARNGGLLHLLTKALPKQLQVEDSPVRMGKNPKGTAGIAHYRPHSPARLSRNHSKPYANVPCFHSFHLFHRSLLVVCVHNGLYQSLWPQKHHLDMSVCIVSLHQPELVLIQLTNGCCWGAITSCTKPECSCWCGWWEMVGFFLNIFRTCCENGLSISLSALCTKTLHVPSYHKLSSSSVFLFKFQHP